MNEQTTPTPASLDGRDHKPGDIMTTAQTQLGPSPREVNDWRELAARENDGLEVTLTWSKSADQVRVNVSDLTSDSHFTLDVSGAEALIAYHHPFSFTSAQDSCLGESPRESGIQLGS